MDNKEVAIQKYNAIAKANKTMFIVVSVASVIVSAAVVLSIFLAQKIAFRVKVVSKQNETISAIENSLENIEKLKKEVQALQSNDALKTSKANAEDNALRVILDALPSEANAEAIGSSLNKNILNVPGLMIESMSVDPIIAEPNTASSSSTSSDSSSSTSSDSSSSGLEDPNAISEKVKTANFSFIVIASSENTESMTDEQKKQARTASKIIIELLEKMEKSIRTFNITDFKIEMTSADKITLSVVGQAYYLPRYNLQLEREVIKSTDSSVPSTGSASNSATTSGGN